jgi:phospholipid/cholesterol/gamma-HCH transport system substrate-binding protein
MSARTMWKPSTWRGDRRRRRLSAVTLGVIFVLAVLALFLTLFNKDRIGTFLRGGETITVHFAADYKLRKFISVVKTAYVPVGKVSDVERAADGSALVTLKVDANAVDTLGSAPTATVRATTLLGGIYFVDLQPGGDPGRFAGTEIPIERAHGPVELGQVVQALQPDSLKGLQDSVGNLDDTLGDDGSAALRRLTRTAPAALGPAATVLNAAMGSNPGDLTNVVTGLEKTAKVLTQNTGQLDAIANDMATTSTVLGDRSQDIGTAIDALPATLDSTRIGLARLSGTLNTLRDTASDIRPVATQLTSTLDTLNPVLAHAVPLVRDTRVLLTDARPLVEQLVPASSTATTALANVRGPVLDRLNGPINTLLQTPYKGTGPYDSTSSDRPLYWDAVYSLVDLGRASAYEDQNGGTIGFQPGLGSGTASGLPLSLDQMVKRLSGSTFTDPPKSPVPPFNDVTSQPPGTGPLGLVGGN